MQWDTPSASSLDKTASAGSSACPHRGSAMAAPRTKPHGKAKTRKAPKLTEANGCPTPNNPRKPSIPYSEEIADIICARLEAGESLLAICSSDGLPTEAAVRKWAADPAHPFSAKYARAREVGYVKMADEVIALSDGLEAGANRFDPGVVQRHRLMVDSRKWILGKCLPKSYGDRVQAEVTGKDGAPLQIEAAAAVRALLEAMPDLMNGKVEGTGLLALASAATATEAAEVIEASAAPSDGER